MRLKAKLSAETKFKTQKLDIHEHPWRSKIQGAATFFLLKRPQ